MFHSLEIHQDVLRLSGGQLMEWDKKGHTEFVAKCPNCQKVKVHHQRSEVFPKIIVLLLGSEKN